MRAASMRELAGARIRKARWNPGGRTLELLLRAGGTGAEGESDLLFRYRNVSLLEPALPALAALVEDASLVVQRSELNGAVGAWRQRLEFAPAGEILIECAAVEEREAPVPGQDYLEAGFRFEVLSC